MILGKATNKNSSFIKPVTNVKFPSETNKEHLKCFVFSSDTEEFDFEEALEYAFSK